MRLPDKAYRIAVNVLARGIRSLMKANGIRGHFCIGAERTYFEIDKVRLEYHYSAFGASGNIDSGGASEPETRELLITHLGGPTPVFYDIGAPEGLFCLDAKIKSPGAVVHAFEPQAAALLRNIQINDVGIAVHEVAVGDTAGAVSMTTQHRSSNFVTATQGSIPLVRLDDLPDLPPPSAIKIDVEGFELKVLQGARRLLSDHNQVVVTEINHCFLRYNDGLKPLYDLMFSLGYSLNRLTNGSLIEILDRPTRPEDLPRSADDNYWWIPARQPLRQPFPTTLDCCRSTPDQDRASATSSSAR